MRYSIPDNQNVDCGGAAQVGYQQCAAPFYSAAGFVDKSIYDAVSPFNEDKDDYRFFCAKSSKGKAVWGAIYPILIYLASTFVSTFAIMFFFLFIGRYGVSTLLSDVMADLMVLELASQALAASFLVPIYLYQRKHSFPQAVHKDNATRWKMYIFGGIGVICVAFGSDLLGLLVNACIPVTLDDGGALEMLEHAIVNSDIVISMLALAVLAPIVEEVMFRGLVLEKLSHAFSAKTAIFISAVIFGIAHANLVQFVFATIFGIGLGYLYMKTHSIIPGIIAHCLNNFIATLLSAMGASSMVELAVLLIVGIATTVLFVKFVHMDDIRVLRNKTLVDEANAAYSYRFNIIYGSMQSPMQSPQYAMPYPYAAPSQYAVSSQGYPMQCGAYPPGSVGTAPQAPGYIPLGSAENQDSYTHRSAGE